MYLHKHFYIHLYTHMRIQCTEKKYQLNAEWHVICANDYENKSRNRNAKIYKVKKNCSTWRQKREKRESLSQIVCYCLSAYSMKNHNNYINVIWKTIIPNPFKNNAIHKRRKRECSRKWCSYYSIILPLLSLNPNVYSGPKNGFVLLHRMGFLCIITYRIKFENSLPLAKDMHSTKKCIIIASDIDNAIFLQNNLIKNRFQIRDFLDLTRLESLTSHFSKKWWIFSTLKPKCDLI